MGFKTVPATHEKEEEVRTKIAMMVAMAAVVLVALVDSASDLSHEDVLYVGCPPSPVG